MRSTRHWMWSSRCAHYKVLKHQGSSCSVLALLDDCCILHYWNASLESRRTVSLFRSKSVFCVRACVMAKTEVPRSTIVLSAVIISARVIRTSVRNASRYDHRLCTLQTVVDEFNSSCCEPNVTNVWKRVLWLQISHRKNACQPYTCSTRLHNQSALSPSPLTDARWRHMLLIVESFAIVVVDNHDSFTQLLKLLFIRCNFVGESYWTDLPLDRNCTRCFVLFCSI